MKKLLALVLALVMVMGLATVGTNAATEYSDKADINFEEAVQVMSSIGVLEGADGKFRPAAELKRSEAAKIVAYLYYNNKTAAGLTGVGKFSDVPANHWAAGYVDTLANSGIISGTSATTYNPDGDLKAIDFAKMLLVCIGFDAKLEGLVGADYQINTSKLATQAGLFNGLKSLKANDILTREQAAQMAFNAIKAATVEYTNKGGEISLNGATVSLGASTYQYVTTTLAKEQRIDDRKLTNTGTNQNGGYTVEFGERQYPDLRLVKTTDAFGRPANEWTNGKETVGKYVDKENLLGSFTTYVTGADLYNLIGEAKIKNSTDDQVHYFVNGKEFTYVTPTQIGVDHKDSKGNTLTDADFYRVGGVDRSNMIRTNKTPYVFTGNGVLTEVYEKGDDLYIVSIMTYYAQADGDYDSKNEVLKIDQLNKGVANGGIAPTFGAINAKVSIADAKNIANYKDDAHLLVKVAYNKSTNQYDVHEVADAKVETAQTITKYSVGNEKAQATPVTTPAAAETTFFNNGYAVVGGAQKVFNKTVELDEELRGYDDVTKSLDSTYMLAYDELGYVVRAKIENAKVNYVFIAGLDTGTSNLGAKTADAFAIFADGTSANIKVNLSKSNEYIAAYTNRQGGGAQKIDGNTTAGKWLNAKGKWEFDVTGNNTVAYAQLGGATPDWAYNRWFYYTTEGEGANAVYTLKPVAQSLMVKDHNSALNTVTTDNPHGDGNEYLKINTKTARLVGDYTDYQTEIGGAAPLQAWGNEKTTYITVKTAKTDGAVPGTAYARNNSNEKRGIAEVAGIYTGIQNVDITAYQAELATPNWAGKSTDDKKEINDFYQSAWAVFNNDNYIVAAVVMGSDGGDSGHYVYAVSEARSEWKEGSYYYWNFNAIVDGEEKELTVKTKYGDVINAIKAATSFDGKTAGSAAAGTEGALFDVTFDKDGYVTKASLVGTVGEVAKYYNNEKLMGTTNGTERSRAFKEEKAYNVYNLEGDVYSYAANTLYDTFKNSAGAARTNGNSKTYVSTAAFQGAGVFVGDVGLTIKSGAPIYVVQQYRSSNTGKLETKVEKFTSLDKALGAIAVGGEQKTSADTRILNGYVSAALDSNCTAKWVVIKNVGSVVTNTESQQAVVAPTGLAIAATPAAVNHTITVAPKAGTFTANDVIKYEIYGRPLGASTYTQVTTGNVTIGTTTGATTASIVFDDGTAGTPVGFTTGASYYVVLTYPDNTTAQTDAVGAL